MAYPPVHPLLLARRLSSFLHTSLESLQDQQPPPVLQTALLVSPSGALLAYESPVPVSTLRTQSAVAASLWTIHESSSPSVATALGQQPSQQQQPHSDHESSDDSPTRRPSSIPPTASAHDGGVPTSIAASFNGGAVFVVRRLQCGLLFACATAPPNTNWRQQHASYNDQHYDPRDAGTSILMGGGATVSSASTAAAAAAADDLALLPADDMTQSSLLQKSASKVALHGMHSLSLQRVPSAQQSPAAPPARTAADPPSPTSLPAGHPNNSNPPLGGAAGKIAGGAAGSYATPVGAERGRGTGSGGRPDAAYDVGNDAASTTTVATATTAGDGDGAGSHPHGRVSVVSTVAIARQQVEELARLLDDKFASFQVPEDSLGINGFC